MSKRFTPQIVPTQPVTPEHWLLVSDDITGPLQAADEVLTALGDVLNSLSLASELSDEVPIRRQTLDFLTDAILKPHAEITKALRHALEIRSAVLVAAPEYDLADAVRLCQARMAAETKGGEAR